MSNMMAISVSVADTAGALVLRMTSDTDIREGSRRVTRTKTLDGGCTIYDGGFSHSDRTWNVMVWADETLAEAIIAIMQTYTLVNVAIGEGFFRACIEKAERIEDKVRLLILVKEKLT